ncbi:MAG: hypothetical protein A2542_04085 [Parcubacteria group bacterium RIFOXYD2_FULL_52_8]|nr:MAG: hypothetical protein A2542_04085 [Parcubacteria group bacterium RIFOXYD2_FULL_52_8]
MKRQVLGQAELPRSSARYEYEFKARAPWYTAPSQEGMLPPASASFAEIVYQTHQSPCWHRSSRPPSNSDRSTAPAGTFYFRQKQSLDTGCPKNACGE